MTMSSAVGPTVCPSWRDTPRVDALLSTTRRAPDEASDVVDARRASATIDSRDQRCDGRLLARAFPVVLATMDAMADPRYNLHATHRHEAGAQQWSSSTDRSGIDSRADGQRCLGPGGRPTPIGRAYDRDPQHVAVSARRFDRAGFSHPGASAGASQKTMRTRRGRYGRHKVRRPHGDATSVYRDRVAVLDHQQRASMPAQWSRTGVDRTHRVSRELVASRRGVGLASTSVGRSCSSRVASTRECSPPTDSPTYPTYAPRSTKR